MGRCNHSTAAAAFSAGVGGAPVEPVGNIGGRAVKVVKENPVDVANTTCSIARRIASSIKHFARTGARAAAGLKVTGLCWFLDIPAAWHDLVESIKELFSASTTRERVDGTLSVAKNAGDLTLDADGTAAAVVATTGFVEAGKITAEVATVTWLETLGMIVLPVKVLSFLLNYRARKSCKTIMAEIAAAEEAAGTGSKSVSVLQYLTGKTTQDGKLRDNVTEYDLKKRFKVSDPSQLREDMKEIVKRAVSDDQEVKKGALQEAETLVNNLKGRVSRNLLHKDTKMVSDAVSVVAWSLLLFVPVTAPFMILVLISCSVASLCQLYCDQRDFKDKGYEHGIPRLEQELQARNRLKAEEEAARKATRGSKPWWSSFSPWRRTSEPPYVPQRNGGTKPAGDRADDALRYSTL